MAEARLKLILEALWKGQGVTQANQALSGLGSGAANAAGGLTKLAQQALGVTSALVAAKKAFDFSREGAEILELRDAGEALASDFDMSMERIVAAIKKGGSGTISEMDAIATATRVMNLGIVESEEQFGQLATIAESLGDRLGMNTAESLENVARALTMMNPRMLASSGITADADGVWARYAATLGKSAKELTDAEKRTALIEDALKRMGGQALSAADNFDRVSAEIADGSARMKTAWAEFTAPAVAGTADFLESVNDLSAAQEVLEDRIVMVKFGLFEMADGSRLTGEQLIELAGQVTQAAEGTDGWLQALQTAPGDLQAVADAAAGIGGAIMDVKDAQESVWESTDTGVERFITGWLEMIEFMQSGGPQLMAASQEVADALKAGIISPEEAQGMFEDLFVAAQDLQVEMGNITPREAADRIREQLGGSLTDARERAKEIGERLDALPRNIQIRIEYLASGNVPSGGNDDDRQHGGSFVVPPGFPRDSFRLGLTSGEAVSVTPAGQRTTNNNVTIQLGGAAEDEAALVDRLTRAVRRL